MFLRIADNGAVRMVKEVAGRVGHLGIAEEL